jgi:phenylalanyl-tRNA synthetase beta chain
MLLSTDLLKTFVKTEKSAEEIANRITLSLTEVEKIEQKGNDTILEIENKALTHRPDCFSHLGISREIAGYFNETFNDPIPNLGNKKIERDTDEKPLTVSVESKDLCHRYSCIVLTDLKVDVSPEWLSNTLTNLGIRPINNVVDVTNYVMIALGQPLHAFDYGKIEKSSIIVRTAKDGETITTLDGKNRTLTTHMLIIADSKKPIGIAGIMGGENTEVTNGTHTIVLESANFEAKNNRQTSKALNMRTDAATRFEKNLDPHLAYPALIKTVELLQEIAGAKIASRIFDIRNTMPSEKKVETTDTWINSFLGTSISKEEIQKLLSRLSFSSEFENGNLVVHIPTFRPDIEMESDIAEEVARMYGYDKIPTTLPADFQFTPNHNKDIDIERKIKLFLMSMGYFEVSTPPFVGDDLLSKSDLSKHEHLELQNPLTLDQKYMRRVLIPSLISLVKRNKPYTSLLNLYEMSRIYVPRGSDMPLEHVYLSSISTSDYRHVKGNLEELFDRLSIGEYSFNKYPEDCDIYNCLFHTKNTAQIYIENKPVGVVGLLHPKIHSAFNIENTLVGFDIHVGSLVEKSADTIYAPLPQYPPIIEDLTISVTDKSSIGDLINVVKQKSTLIKNVELLNNSFENKRTFRITFQTNERNLTEKEVNEIKEKIIRATE